MENIRHGVKRDPNNGKQSSEQQLNIAKSICDLYK